MKSSRPILGYNPSALKCGKFREGKGSYKGQNCNGGHIVALVLNLV